MSVLDNSLLLGAAPGGGGGGSGAQISRSLRFNSADSAYLSRTPASAGNRKTWTWSGWVKRSALSGGSERYIFNAGFSTDDSRLQFNGSDFLSFKLYQSAVVTDLTSAAVYRDFSAWYHLVLAVDTTQATSTDRVKVYINGLQVTISGTYPTQNLDTSFNAAQPHAIAGRSLGGAFYFDGYLADIHFIDGQALTPASFGETNAVTGRWEPKAYTGTYGTNGFKLDFADNSAATAAALGKDTSGNGNNWTPNNLSVTAGAGNDSLIDTPTSGSQVDTGLGGQVTGNYCTLNPLDKSSSISLANGNLDHSISAAAAWHTSRSTIAITSGKWYWETTCSAATGAGNGLIVGVVNSAGGLPNYIGSSSGGYGYSWDAFRYNAGVSAAYGAGYTNGDIIGIAFDATAWTITFYKNGVSQGTAYSSIAPDTYFPGISLAGTLSGSTNFGQRPFAYTAPSGFKALCDTNLPAPVVAKPSTVMDVKLYTGNGGTQSITGLGFSPDLVWVKRQSAAADHLLQDQVRGATAWLCSSRTDAENTNTSSDWFRAFTSDGFTIAYQTTGGTPTNEWNASGSTYVAWAWDAGSSTVTNTSGTISSQVRANPSAGFSIVTYTGTGANATVGHGLGVAPSMIIAKSRNTAATNWGVYHSGVSATPQNSALNLDNTGAIDTQSVYWNNTAPTSTVFSIGTWGGINGSARTYVAYCFAPVAGYSSFGSYTGNGSADGPFVYTGFRPRWVMVKRSDVANYWILQDTARNSYNVTDLKLSPSTASAENDLATVGDATQNTLDILSNGFKCKTSNAGTNASGGTYIYAAFAESPFQYSRAR